MAYSVYEIWYRSTRNYYGVIYLLTEREWESKTESGVEKEANGTRACVWGRVKTPPCLLPIHRKLHSLSHPFFLFFFVVFFFSLLSRQDEIWLVSVPIVSNMAFCFDELYDAFRGRATWLRVVGGLFCFDEQLLPWNNSGSSHRRRQVKGGEREIVHKGGMKEGGMRDGLYP